MKVYTHRVLNSTTLLSLVGLALLFSNCQLLAPDSNNTANPQNTLSASINGTQYSSTDFSGTEYMGIHARGTLGPYTIDFDLPQQRGGTHIWREYSSCYQPNARINSISALDSVGRMTITHFDGNKLLIAVVFDFAILDSRLSKDTIWVTDGAFSLTYTQSP